MSNDSQQKGFICGDCGNFVPCDAAKGSNDWMRAVANHFIRRHGITISAAVEKDGEVHEI